jgi:hypothetical protein
MIYFRFQISPLSTEPPQGAEMRTADFFFDSSDAAGCTRRASSALATLGWKPVNVSEAQEAYGFAELEAEDSLEPYFEDAEREGMAFRINYRPLPVLPSQGMELTTDLGFEVANSVTEFPPPLQ